MPFVNFRERSLGRRNEGRGETGLGRNDVWGVGWGYDGNYRKFLLITAIGGARDVEEKRGGAKGKVQFN